MICKNCLHEINDDDVFCGNCGSRIEKESVIEENNQVENEENTVETESIESSFDPYGNHGEVEEVEKVSNDTELQPNDLTHDFAEFNDDISSGQNDNISDVESETKGSINLSLNKEKTKKIAIIVAIVIAVLIVVLAAFKGYSNYKLKQPIELDLNDYIVETYKKDSDLVVENVEEDDSWDYDLDDSNDYDEYGGEEVYMYSNNENIGPALLVYGYSGYAYIYEEELYSVIDWSKLYDDYSKAIAKKSGYSEMPITSFINSECFVFEADKLENIANGDKITVSVKMTENEYCCDIIKLRFKEAKMSYTIDNLQEVNAFDPFEYIEVSAFGVNGGATVFCNVIDNLNKNIENTDGLSAQRYSDDCVSIIKNDYIIAKIVYSVDDENQDRFSNDDNVNISCYCEEYNTLLDDYNLYIASFNKNYKISGLGEYIGKDFAFDDETLKMYKTHAKKEMEDCFYYDSYSNFKYVGSYISDPKDKTDSYDEKNILYVVYSYDYSWYDEEVETRYFCVQYRNIIGTDDKILYGPKDYYYERDYGFESIDDAIDKYDNKNMNYKEL